jgi:hypothetical protein
LIIEGLRVKESSIREEETSRFNEAARLVAIGGVMKIRTKYKGRRHEGRKLNSIFGVLLRKSGVSAEKNCKFLRDYRVLGLTS